jgi:hypothetical protein
MHGWTDGDLETEFERRLDSLLADLCPAWQPPGLTEPYGTNEKFEAYDRRNAKRIQVGDVLTTRHDITAALADRVLAAIVCDEDVSFNKQLVRPVLDTVGRRPVQQYLISVIETGSAHKKVCAVRAWYWSQVTLVYESVRDLREHQPSQASRAADDEVADLRGEYRIACLTAFVESDHMPTRDWLARGFLLVEQYYPPNLHNVVAQARAIAEAHRHRFKDLLAKDDAGTNMAQIGSGSL